MSDNQRAPLPTGATDPTAGFTDGPATRTATSPGATGSGTPQQRGTGRSEPARQQLPVTAVLWDIDGTLLTSRGGFARTLLDACERVVGHPITVDGVPFGGRLDPEITGMILAAAGADPGLLEEVLALFRSLVEQRRDELVTMVDVLPGVTQSVGALARAGVRQTVVTGNLRAVGELKLHAAGLVPPLELAPGGFGDSGDGQDRAQLVRIAMQALRRDGWDGPEESCWVIGDTPRDHACARAAGVPCALVATGRFSLDSLAELEPDLLLPSLDLPHPLLPTC